MSTDYKIFTNITPPKHKHNKKNSAIKWYFQEDKTHEIVRYSNGYNLIYTELTRNEFFIYLMQDTIWIFSKHCPEYDLDYNYETDCDFFHIHTFQELYVKYPNFDPINQRTEKLDLIQDINDYNI
jgi:hypothetical protein